MHPDLEKIDSALNSAGKDQMLAWRFGLACVEEVADNLESDEVIAVLERFRLCVANNAADSQPELQELSSLMAKLSASHPGSKSLDGTRHAAVSATYALAKAVNGRAVEAAAYAAYSQIYAYGGYAVTDPECFSQVHRIQLKILLSLIKPTLSTST